jgi:hypothetical protein
MKKIVIFLTGVVFVLGVMLPVSYAQYKQEKNAPMGGIPKQNTLHIGVDKKDAAAAKTEQKAPAAPEQKAVTSEPPAPADTKAPAKDTKKSKKGKKTKKTKKTE